MLNDIAEDAARDRAPLFRPHGGRMLDGAIEWHPPRIAELLLDRLGTAPSWPAAARVLADTIATVVGASETRGWIVDAEGGSLRSIDAAEAPSSPSIDFEPRAAAWLMAPGLRRIAAKDLPTDPLLRALVGPVTERGCGLVLTTAADSAPATLLAWAIDDEVRLPSWAGRVLSEFAIGVPSWWALLESLRERTRRLEASEKDRIVALACRGLLHDLDNAILPIRCRLDLLFSTRRTSDELRHLESISASVEQLRQLALDLRAKLDHDGDPSEPTRLSLWWAAQHGTIAAALPPHATLVGAIPESLPPIAMPEAALTQAIVNLATNAGKAIGDAGAVVVSAVEAGSRRVRITVSDNGAGIAPEALEAIRRGIRERRAERLKGRGAEERRNGFGLAIVEELAERWGGRLEIESTPGVGTRIGIVVPIALRDEAPSRSAIVEIVDDRRRWVIAEMLRCLGVRAIPRAGRGTASEAAPSVVEGLECAAALRAEVEAEPDGDAAPTIWIADGSLADEPSLCQWLDADERRLAIAVGGATGSHARLRVLDARVGDADTLASLRGMIRESARMAERPV